MKIGLLKETKSPVDNRVALSPKQVAKLNNTYKKSQIVVQSSDIRAFSDEEYRKEGVEVVDNVEDCDILFGIKEVNISNLIPNKHYFFFGHIAKMQPYNRPLLQTMLNNNLTFTDYEYLVDEKTEDSALLDGGLVSLVSITHYEDMDLKQKNLNYPNQT